MNNYERYEQVRLANNILLLVGRVYLCTYRRNESFQIECY
jgi:hypothetical protein